jgi:hypothetical protein
MLDITPIIIAGSVLVAAAIAYPFIKNTKPSDLLNFNQSGGKKTRHRRNKRARRTRRR